MTLAMRLVSKAAKHAFKKAKEGLDPDRWLQVSMGGLIETARTRHESDPSPTWRPGEPLRLLLAGYVGTRNTGADVRVEEMIRQFRHLFGDDHIDLSICTIDPELTKGYFRTAKQLHIPQIFHRFLFDAVRQSHGVIACEGSMFKSKFANALSTMMVGALGLASAEDKISVGYGGEAGHMDKSLRDLVARYASESLILTRNEESSRVLTELGVPVAPGTDTAWTFESGGDERAETLLKRAGWDGRREVVAVCPINPFWWPVRPEPFKAALRGLSGAFAEDHYKSIYFHESGPDVERALRNYLTRMAGAIRDYERAHDTFTVLIAHEQLDRRAVEALNEILGGDRPMLFSSDLNMYEMVAVLRRSSLVVSSRYHALVCSMPALVPSVGVTMDERIRNLMIDRGTPELALQVDDDSLDENLLAAMEWTRANRERVKDSIGRTVVANLVRMGRMGATLVDYVREIHPEFPFEAHLGGGGDPLAHLPPPGPTVERLLEQYGERASAA